MDKPRCQGCLGELKVERPKGLAPYVWCLRCGARDDRDPLVVIALLERERGFGRPHDPAGASTRHSPRMERADHGHAGGTGQRPQRSRSPDAS
jgi:hypothetical protein